VVERSTPMPSWLESAPTLGGADPVMIHQSMSVQAPGMFFRSALLGWA